MHIEWPRFLVVFAQKNKRPILWSFFATVLAVFAVLALGYALRFLVNEGFQHDARVLLKSLSFLTIIVILIALSSALRFFWSHQVVVRLCAELRDKLFRHLVLHEQTFLTAESPERWVNLLGNDISSLQKVLTNNLPAFLRNLLLVFGGVILLFITHVNLTIIILLTVLGVLVILLSSLKYVRLRSFHYDRNQKTLFQIFDETLRNVSIIQGLTAENRLIDKFKNQLHETQLAADQYYMLRAIFVFLAFTLSLGAILVVVYMGGQSVIHDGLSRGDLSAFLFYAVLVTTGLASLSEHWGEIHQAFTTLNRIQSLLNQNPSIVINGPLQLPLPEDLTLKFNNVSFLYPDSMTPALQNISFTLTAGEKAGLIGYSGAGKTTFFKLLLRFYDPASGQIYLGGQPLDKLHLEDLRRAIAWVPQDPVIFSGTVYENILYGNPEASYEAVYEAARQAFAHDFIQRLPQQFETKLGPNLRDLSRGEKQRIALARTFLQNPKFVLLDEPTSSLDVYHEARIQEALQQLMEKRTTLVIAHRLSTIQQMDTILVLHRGEILEKGAPHQLYEQHGLYTHFVNLQHFSEE
jgi:ATP-binding cassette, subfamily B, bacterial